VEVEKKRNNYNMELAFIIIHKFGAFMLLGAILYHVYKS